jgi:HTH-type transcriptional regulator/antitoxin MqsA
MDATLRRASDAIRREEGLLSSKAIRGIRQNLGLTQHEFEKLLGVGPKTVVRWEKGTVFQNRSTDSLLRVIDALPESARFLARLHGVTLKDRPGVAVH